MSVTSYPEFFRPHTVYLSLVKPMKRRLSSKECDRCCINITPEEQLAAKGEGFHVEWSSFRQTEKKIVDVRIVLHTAGTDDLQERVDRFVGSLLNNRRSFSVSSVRIEETPDLRCYCRSTSSDLPAG